MVLKKNIEKSCGMIFNLREQPEHLCNIKVVQKMKNLGIEIDNKINYVKIQRDKIIQNARKMANITYCVIEKSCNKLLIGKNCLEKYISTINSVWYKYNNFDR